MHVLLCWHCSLPVLLRRMSSLLAFVLNIASSLFAQCWQDIQYGISDLNAICIGAKVSCWCLQPCSEFCLFILDLVFLTTICCPFLGSNFGLMVYLFHNSCSILQESTKTKMPNCQEAKSNKAKKATKDD